MKNLILFILAQLVRYLTLQQPCGCILAQSGCINGKTNLITVSNKARLAWYGTAVFLSSAVLLVLEITAGRLIAPYVGITIYSWTSIIGVILAGLSLGNWLGGCWADRGADERSTGIALALAAMFSLLSLLLLTIIAPLLQASSLDLISASFIYVLCLFFIPALLLGIPTPLLTTLALQLDDRTGHVVGRMHALSALGSICGTFLTGFYSDSVFRLPQCCRHCIVDTVTAVYPIPAENIATRNDQPDFARSAKRQP